MVVGAANAGISRGWLAGMEETGPSAGLIYYIACAAGGDEGQDKTRRLELVESRKTEFDDAAGLLACSLLLFVYEVDK